MQRTKRHTAAVTWRRFSHKAYAAFQSLHREVRIGVLGVAMLSACTFVKQPANMTDRLQTGDLLFCLETQEDGLGGAIAAVNEGIAQQNVSHVAIVVEGRGAGPESQNGMLVNETMPASQAEIHVIEATPQAGVRILSLSQFLTEAHHAADGSPLIIVGRLKDTTGVAASVRHAMTYLGLPYDTLYLPDETAIYCSELVQLSYRRPDGTAIFPQQPMSFSDSTGTILPYWIELYREHGMEVPEGLPGTHPATMSRDTAIVIINNGQLTTFN